MLLLLAALFSWSLSHVVQGQGLQLSASPTQLAVGSSLALSLGYAASNPVTTSPADLYVALRVPGDPNLYFFPNFVTTPTPWVRSWTPQPVAAVNFFNHSFVGGEPEGDYQIYAALTKAGTIDLVGGLGSATAKYLRAQGVMSSSPANGAAVSVSPIFTVVFSGAVDLNSVLDNSEVTVTSLQSGKVATLYTGLLFPGDTTGRLVRLDYPNGTGSVTTKLSADTISLVSFELSSDSKTLSLPFRPVEISGTTFALSPRGSYTFSIKFLTGARLVSGYSLAGVQVGPIGFSVQ